MFTIVLVLLCAACATANSPSVRVVCSNPPRPDDKVRLEFQTQHNNYRTNLATGTVDDAGGTLPGSTSLFMMSYNCELEIQALTVTSACDTQSNTPTVIGGNSINYGIIHSHPGAPSDDDAVKDIQALMTKWMETSYEYNFDKKTVIYGSEDAGPFARIVYNKSISLGCAITQCAARKTAYACAYSSSPVVGEPLYWPSKNPTGCTRPGQCRKAIPGTATTCDTNLNLCSTNLLTLDDSTSAAPTTQSQTTTPAPAESTTPAAVPGASGVMTDALRQMVVDTHNRDRSLLAQGTIRNGKPGKPNLGTATNMLRMRYDMAMETEAQAYADTCILNKSAVAIRPNSGENVYVIQSSTITVSDALTQSMQSWWNQIFINGLNARLMYTLYLETKSNAPLDFTQMGWAATYKVGCGVSRCGMSTFVVCRYNPRGNIIDQFIYNVGSICATCMSSCTDALCATPAY
ncbi:hypothetical protein NECAME_01369 [Necator americanus]|uniref:SCP domain-containing protein n=1 Tax=Necator americanus TaxID=51031 RepID=W2TYV5_NECAM|nr:hypothetical protein NECAME_01369 [Necator americanus]ETN86241.1 hypothetical protein NECAME_01369 [Necator americanus]